MPVGGTLDDPSFRIGPIIWQVIKNIITKVVTAPFAFLGSLFEGAEEAQFVDFVPGDATLDADTAGRLSTLGKGLVEKPELRLDVPIGALAEVDGPALAARAYEAALAGAVAARSGGKDGGAAPAYAALEPAQKIEVLTALLTARTGVVPQVPEPPTPPEGTSRSEAKALAEAAAVEYLDQAARSRSLCPRRTSRASGGARAGDRASAADRHRTRAHASLQGARRQGLGQRGQGPLRARSAVAAAYPTATGAVTAELRKPCPPDCWQ